MRIIALLGLTALLSACSSWQSKTPADLEWQAHQQQIRGIKHWHLQGKLGVRTAEEATNASVNWRQHLDAYEIRLSGPFGQGVTVIRGDKHAVSIQQSGQPTLNADDPEQLLEQRLGWQFPLSQVYYWIRGMPAPQLRVQSQDVHNGLLMALHQGEWQLQFDRYQTVEPPEMQDQAPDRAPDQANQAPKKTPAELQGQASGVTPVQDSANTQRAQLLLPGKIVLRNESLKITLILKKWRLDKPQVIGSN